MGKFKLQFSESKIRPLASLYTYPHEDRVESIVDVVKRAGQLNKEQFMAVCEWKSPRSKNHCAKNDPSFIAEISQCALSTNNERMRIEAWTLLDGVNWPTASVFLHWFHHDKYPILDFRALESLSVKSQKYDFDLWWEYTEYCRELAAKNKVSMRILDRALWQYSKSQSTAKKK